MADSRVLRYSERFPNGEKILAEVAKRNMEGIFSKHSDHPYRSGKNPGWIKVKCSAWRAANADRWEVVQRPPRS